MARFFEALRNGVHAANAREGPARFSIDGRPVRCPHCGCEHFGIGRAQLNTAGMTFFGLDWADKSASTLLCAECGNIQWFAQTPNRVE